MHRRTLLALLATSLAAPAFAQDNAATAVDQMAAPAGPLPLTPEQTDLVNQISAHNSAITSMTGKFLQVDTQGSRIEGVFYLQRPGKIRFRYAPPSHEEIISIGQGFYVIDRAEKTQYAYPQDKVPLRQFLDEKIDLLNAGFVGMADAAGYVSVMLEDDTPIGTVRVSLVFDKDSQDLVQWVLTDPSGVDLTFSLYDIQKGVQIPPAYFFLNINDYNRVEPK
ncbi:MAG: outer membrane lipoprotein carrier protein LolA [Devosia sp.]